MLLELHANSTGGKGHVVHCESWMHAKSEADDDIIRKTLNTVQVTSPA